MRYEHLVEINDPLQPLLDPLTRTQLWRGLQRRATDPLRFVFGLDGYALRRRTERDDGAVELERTLDFGTFAVRDRVELIPPDLCVTHVPASAHHGASRLAIRIEEPRPQRLYLRFVYESLDEHDPDAGPHAAATRALREQAYYLADLDTVGALRALAAAGELGA